MLLSIISSWIAETKVSMSDLKLPFYSTLLGREATSQDLAKAVPRERIGFSCGGKVFLEKMFMSSKFVGSHIWSRFPLVFWRFFLKSHHFFKTKTIVSNLSGWKMQRSMSAFTFPSIAGRLLGGSCEQCCALHCWNGSNGGSQVSRSLPGNRPKGTMGTGQ